MKNIDLQKIKDHVSAYWHERDPESYRPAARTIIQKMPDVIRAAQGEKSQKKELTESSKAILRSIVNIAKKCERSARSQGDGETAARLTAAKWALRSKFNLDEKITEPMVHPEASGNFIEAVNYAIGKLPDDVRKKIGDKAFFVEIDPESVRGITTTDGGDRRIILITAGMSKSELFETIWHECAHVYKDHKTGGYQAEKEVSELLKAWGLSNIL